MGKWIKCIVVFLVTVSGYGENWSVWRGPNKNGISAETGWNLKKAKELWKKELGVGYSSVSVKDGKLYTMGNKDSTDFIYCLEAKTGKEIWNHSYDCEPGKFKGPRATPVIDNDKLYTVSRDGLVICFDAVSGKVQWEGNILDKTKNNNIRWGISSSAVIDGDLLLLNIGKSGVALNKTTGEIEWKSKGKPSYATPVVFNHKDEKYAAVFSASGLHVVDVKTGKRIDKIKWETDYDINGADPLVIGDRIFISSGYERGCAMLDFSSSKLAVVWENDVLKNHFSSSVYIDGYIYGIDDNHNKKASVRCIDPADGSEKWSKKTGFGSLMAADGKLIVLDDRGSLFTVEVAPDQYKELARFDTGLGKTCWTAPVLANGIIYCRNDKGTLVAIDVR